MYSLFGIDANNNDKYTLKIINLIDFRHFNNSLSQKTNITNNLMVGKDFQINYGSIEIVFRSFFN